MFRRGLLSLVLLLGLSSPLLVSAAEPTLSNGFTGAETAFRTGLWWNPKRSGHGVDLHFSGERLFVIWYTYDEDGQSIWYTGQGKKTGTRWELSLLKHRWNEAGRSAAQTDVGEMILRFSDATHAKMSWKIGVEKGEESIEPFQLAGVGAADDHTGAWYVASEPGYGLTVNHQGSYEMLVFYFYDTDGKPRWVLGNNGGELGEAIKVASFQTACPTCADLKVTSVDAGEIKTTFRAETEARLDLQIQLDTPLKLDWKLVDKPVVMLSNPPSGRAHSAALAKFASPEALEQFIEDGLRKRFSASNPESVADGGLTVSAAPPASSGRSFSTTNLQEQGVDEADRLKTDGRYMYVANQAGDQVRVLKLFKNPYKAEEKTVINFGRDQIAFNGLYLVNNRSSRNPDLLISVHGGETGVNYAPEIAWDTPFAWINGKTELRFFNVNVPERPAEMTRLILDGVLLASRRIGESLYVVTRFSPDVQLQSNGGRVPAQGQQVETLLSTTGLSDLLPQIQQGSASSTSLLSYDQTYLPPIADGSRGTDLITLSKIDLGDLAKKPESVAIVGHADTVYASTKALYIATTRYAFNPVMIGLTVATSPAPSYEPPTTDIHKFSLSADKPEYRGSARIEGYLSGNGQARPFRLSEHEGVLRVVSTGQWAGQGDNRVSLIQESDAQASSLLVELSHLPNAKRPTPLGKPGEQLHATRFVGERLFMVTFKKTDPLITVDLSNSRDPFVRGELEIPGYSDYLHPLSENLLLGVGKEAVEAKDGRGDGQFAWYQGIRIGLFDVSGRSGATELDHLLIGERGSQSELLTDHHAFSLLPPAQFSGEATRFTIPISVTGKEFPVNPPFVLNEQQVWTKTGLYLFEVDTDAVNPKLKSTGAVVVKDQASSGEFDWAEMASGANRSVLLEDGVFYSHQGQVWSAAWQTPDRVSGPR